MKVTIRKKLLARITAKAYTADKAIKNTDPNASTFWQGYQQALNEIKELL